MLGKEKQRRPGKSGNQEQLVLVDLGGEGTQARQKAYIERFEKEFDVKIITESPIDYGKLKAMVESGNVGWDVVVVDTEFIDRGIDQDLLEKLDYDVIDNTNFEPWLISDYGIGAEIWSTSIAYNTDMTPDGRIP